MLKKIVMTLAVAVSVMASMPAQAQYCGGSLMPTGDLGGNGRGWDVNCCPEGYRVHGIACADLPPDQDLLDGCSPICRSIAKGDIMQPTFDFQRQPALSQCDKSEVFAGISCKDMKKGGKGDDDVADGCSAVCQKPNSSALRTLSNGDIDGNPRGAAQVTVMLPQRVVGIACKDIDKGSSDRSDGCTIVVK